MLLGFKLRRLLWRARRLTVDLWGAATTVGAASLVAAGYFPDLRASTADIGPIVAACTLGALVIIKVAARLRALPASERELVADDGQGDLKRDLELGAALVVATYVMVELSGGLASPVYPLVYALVAFIVTFHRRMVGVPLVAVTLGMEALLYRAALHAGTVEPRARQAVLSHATFIGFFALTHFVFLQAEVLRQRRQHRTTLVRAIRNLRDEARDFRLISSSLAADPTARSRESDEERLAVGAVQAIHDTIYFTIDLLKKSLDLNTCVLLWLDDAGERLKIKELVTDSDCVVETAINADAGALGSVVKNRLLVNLKDPKRGHLPYYAAPVEVSFLGVPVMEDGHLRGVLCADRGPNGEVARPFTDREVMIVQNAAEQMLRGIQSERVFAAVERAKYEHERFFAALARLNRALTAEDVYTTTFEATREICEFDFAAITLFDKSAKRHTVVSAVGDAPKGLAGLSFGDNAGIAAMVVKNKHFLPAGGEIRDKDALIFTKKVRLDGMESLLVLPLLSREEAVGSFAVAARRARAFGKDKREMLTVIASHVAVKLSNAQLYGRMEEMATTDGLTGLVNHRTFQERFAEMLARAERTGTKHALLLTDIDHFKKVNDTYGHPTGDVVLRGVAAVVRDCVRKIDLAARYGGEEFAVVLEGTDVTGARQLAERIRAEVQKQVFQSSKGPFSCTLSLGIAVYPDDGKDGKTIIDHADQSLYSAKHGGRNRAVAWPDLQSGPVKIKPAKAS
jgi:two-component system cell cycle response regulator